MSSLKSEILEHIYSVCEIKQINLEREDIQNDFDEFLRKIKAPTTDLQGLYWVFWLVEEISKKLPVYLSKLLNLLNLKSYIFDAVKQYEISLSKVNSSLYHSKSYKKGWCELYPFYVFLIKSHNYNHNEQFLSLILHFIDHFFDVEDVLTDPDLATKSATRENEVCSKFRHLMSHNNTQFQPGQNAFLLTYSKQAIIASLEEIQIENEDQNNRAYINTLLHFYRNDWLPAKSYIRHGRKGDLRFKRYQKPKFENLLSSDSIKVLKPEKEILYDGNGIFIDDLFEQMPYVLINNEDIIEDVEIKSVEKVFSKDTRAKRKVDVTSNVIRSHNIAKQDTRLLREKDLGTLFATLKSMALQKKNRPLAIACWCMFLLNKSFEEVMELNFSYQLEDARTGLDIDKNDDAWWIFNINQSLKTLVVHQGLHIVEEVAITRCPDFLREIILDNLKDKTQQKIFVDEDIKTLKPRLVQKLKKVSEKSNSSRLNISTISNFVIHYINASEVIDPIHIDFSYDVQLYTTRVARSYSNIDDHSRCSMLSKLWQEVTNDYKTYYKEELEFKLFEFEPYKKECVALGSKLTVREDTLSTFINKCVASIEELSKQSNKHSIDWLLNFHNAYVLYVTWMLMFGTGYRAVWNPLPTLSLYVPSLNLLGISDKDDSDFTHSRLVCIPSTLKQQINEYIKHLESLRGLIRAQDSSLALKIDQFTLAPSSSLNMKFDDSASWYADIRNSRNNFGPLFIFEKQITDWKVKPLSPKRLIENLPVGVSIPTNAGRHWLKSQLLEQGVSSELINLQMGHWQVGELPLAKYSSLHYNEVIIELLPHLDMIFEKVKWRKVKSILI